MDNMTDETQNGPQPSTSDPGDQLPVGEGANGTAPVAQPAPPPRPVSVQPPPVSPNPVTGGPQINRGQGQTPTPLYHDQSDANTTDPRDFHPAVQQASVMRRVAETLAGGPRIKTSIDPNTGETTRTPVPLTTRQVLLGAVANILGGAGQIAGNLSNRMEGRAPNPAQPLATQQAAQKQAEQSEEDFNQVQNQKLRKAKVLNANMEALRSAFALGKEDDEAKDSVIQNHADDLANWSKAGAVEASNVPSDELMTKGFDKTKYVAVPDGRVPVFNPDGKRVTDANGVPLSQLTYSVVDGTTQATLSQDKYNQLAKYGLMSAKDGFKLPEGASISSAQLALMNHKLDLIQQTQRELDEVHSAVGGEKVDLAKQIKGNPQMLSAIEQFHNDGASTEPDNQINNLQNSQNPKAKQAAGLMRELFGNSNLEKYKHNRIDTDAASKTAANEKARVNAEESTPTGQLKLQNEKLTGERSRLEIQKLQQDIKDKGGIDLSKVQTNTVDGVTAQADPKYRVNQEALDSINAKDPGMAASVKAIGEARELMTPQAQRTKDGQAILKLVNIAYPDYNAAKVDSYFKGRQVGTSGTLGNKVNSFATAMDHLQRYYDNINGLSATAGIGSIASKLGIGTAKELDTDRTALASEIAAAYKSAGVPSEGDKHDWEAKLGGDTVWSARKGAKETAELLHGKFQEYSNQYQNMIPGGLRDDNFQLMSNQASEAYKRVTGNSIGNTQPLTQGQHPPQSNPRQQPSTVVPAGTRPVTVNGQTTGFVGADGTYHPFGK